MDHMELNNRALLLRKEFGEDSASSIDIFAWLPLIQGLTLIFYPLGKNISGACYKGENSDVIVINSNMTRGRQRFSFAHELYHLRFDEEPGMTMSMQTIGDGTENEKRADRFASYLLMPSTSLFEMLQKRKNRLNGAPIEIEEVIALEQYYGMSHQAMLFRLLEEREITPEQSRNMRFNIIDKAAKLGYDTSLYTPSPEEKKKFVLGHYISQAEKLYQMDRISLGKYEELLLDAFRSDIVYGSEAEGDELLD